VWLLIALLLMSSPEMALAPGPVDAAAQSQSPDAGRDHGQAEAAPTAGRRHSECNQLSLSACSKAARSIEAVNVARAARMYAEICERGDMGKCYRASTLFDRSSNPERDSRRAVALATRSCKAGIGHDCFVAAMILAQGRRDLPRDHVMAARLYRTGCDLRDDDSCSELSSAYEKGLGVPRDVARSKELRKRAEQLGYRDE
jgi:TPR repeat protein